MTTAPITAAVATTILVIAHRASRWADRYVNAHIAAALCVDLTDEALAGVLDEWGAQ